VSRDPSAGARQLLVAIHDVTPAHAERIGRIFDLFATVGVGQYALLVVPNYHGGWPLDAHRDFVDDLRRRQQAGAEIFLHGWRHDEVGLRRSLARVMAGAGRTSREAEFLHLPPPQAADRIDRGLQMFRDLELEPVGFIPPGWLYGRETKRIIRDRHLRITEGMVAIYDGESGRRLVAPTWGWDTRARWLVTACDWLARLRCVVERRARVARVAIHPPDIDDPVARGSLERTLRALLEDREAVSYRTALEEKARLS